LDPEFRKIMLMPRPRPLPSLEGIDTFGASASGSRSPTRSISGRPSLVSMYGMNTASKLKIAALDRCHLPFNPVAQDAVDRNMTCLRAACSYSGRVLRRW
jgi:hypothetical protein